MVENILFRGTTADFGLIMVGSSGTYTAKNDCYVAFFFSTYGGGSCTVSSNGTYVCGMEKASTITNFSGSYTCPGGAEPDGAVIIFHLNAGQYITTSGQGSSLVLLNKCNGAQIVGGSYSATKDEYVIDSCHTYGGSGTLRASNKRIYTFAGGSCQYKYTSSYSIQYSSFCCLYKMSLGDTLPGTTVGSYNALKLL